MLWFMLCFPAFYLQLATLYGGEIEYLFVVEDVADPAYAAITSLIQELTVRKPVALLQVISALPEGYLSGSLPVFKLHEPLFPCQLRKEVLYLTFISSSVIAAARFT